MKKVYENLAERGIDEKSVFLEKGEGTSKMSDFVIDEDVQIVC